MSQILGPFWGPKPAFLGLFLGPFFGPIFEHFFDHFWGPFWDQIGQRSGEDGPKRATKSFKDPKSCICKNLNKNIGFLRFLVSRGLPREAPEAHEGSQEAPKELQDLENKGSKNEPEKYQFLDQFLAHFGSHFGARMGSKICPKLVLFWDPFLDQFLLILRF